MDFSGQPSQLDPKQRSGKSSASQSQPGLTSSRVGLCHEITVSVHETQHVWGGGDLLLPLEEGGSPGDTYINFKRHSQRQVLVPIPTADWFRQNANYSGIERERVHILQALTLLCSEHLKHNFTLSLLCLYLGERGLLVALGKPHPLESTTLHSFG